MHKENDKGRYFAFGEPVSTPAKIINSAVETKFIQMVSISFCWTWELINGKQTQSGQRGICVRMAYLVMRNESSRRGECMEDEEKTCEEDGEDKKPSVSARGKEKVL